MKCPKCGSENLSIVDSRPVDGRTRRRRCCEDCLYRFSTIEVDVDEYKRWMELAATFKKLVDLAKGVYRCN